MNSSAVHPEGKTAAESPTSCKFSYTVSLVYPVSISTPLLVPSTLAIRDQSRIRETKTYNLPGLRALSGVQDPKERVPLGGAQTMEEVVRPSGARTTKERAGGSLGYASCKRLGAEAKWLLLFEKYRQPLENWKEVLSPLCPFSRVPLVLPIVRSEKETSRKEKRTFKGGTEIDLVRFFTLNSEHLANLFIYLFI